MCYLTIPEIQSYHARRAAKLYPIIGRHAAIRYCQKRDIPLRLFFLARMLEAAKTIN